MYTIRQVAERTGFSPDTLRYYEKIGLLHSPQRGAGGVRKYSDDNVRLLVSVGCLKKTGLSLEEIKEFMQEGRCFAKRSSGWSEGELQTIESRRDILADHLRRMEKQRAELESLMQSTQTKLDYYDTLLRQNVN